MLRIITSDDTKLSKRLNGKYSLINFSSNNLSLGTPISIIYFKFLDETNTELVGNNHFTADGYLYNKNAHLTSEYIYYPTNTTDTQILHFKDVRNVNINFYDKDDNTINITEWTMILKKM